MRMLPASPHGTHSQAEKRIFDLLRHAFPEDKKKEYTAYHSLNLTRHAYKRFGEIDFLICCPDGLFVLEVKGGGVSCKNGIWQYTNRFGNINSSREGPFKQAESALHGLREKLGDLISELALSQLTVGYGVIMPDCEFNQQSVEWDAQLFADARKYKDFDHWLKSLIKYWQGKDFKKRVASPSTLKALHDVIRPDVEAVIPLYIQLDSVDERIDILTEDQLHWVDVVEANPRVLCSGGAGTGKTFLALELARRWTYKELNVVLICKSPWLKSFLQNKFKIPNLIVSTVDGLATATRRSGLELFDAVIIDEGQDILDMDNLDKIDHHLKQGLSDGLWCFFHDINNQSGLLGNVDEEAFDYLKALSPAVVPLKTNCRNTRVILDKVQYSLAADMGIRGAGEGPNIREIFVINVEQALFQLINIIDDVINTGGLLPGNLTILSPFTSVRLTNRIKSTG